MDTVLSKAEKLFLRGKYARVLRQLEPQVFQYRENYRFYILLGYACLHTNDWGGALSYLRRAEQLSHGDTAANLGIALVLAKRGETEEAIRIWLTLLERTGEMKEASRGLKLIRESIEFSEISMKLEEGKLERYLRYPRRKGRGIPRLLILIPFLALLAGGVFWLARHPGLFGIGRTRPEIQGIDFFADDAPNPEGSGNYAMSDEEIRATTESILDLMNDYRDNLARREINRLLLSNASQEIKQKARFLISYIQEPSFATLKDSFSYREVAADPRLHEGCYIAWRGRAANIRIEPEAVLFDLLVGYEDEKLLEGIVPVSVDFAVSLEENKRVEVLGMVSVVDRGDDVKPGTALQAVSIHQLIE